MRETPVCTAADAIYKLAAGNLKYLNAENGSPVVSIAITSASEENGIIEYTNALVLPEFCKFYSDGVIQDSKLNVYAQSI